MAPLCVWCAKFCVRSVLLTRPLPALAVPRVASIQQVTIFNRDEGRGLGLAQKLAELYSPQLAVPLGNSEAAP